MSAYLTISKFSSETHVNYLFNFSLIFLALFFADSTFIGPYPFPSSSVVRFFCVYILVFSIYCNPKFGIRQLAYLSFIFPLAVLWSAESAFYSASIILFLLISLILIKEYQILKIYIATLLTSLVFPFIGIAIFYKIKWGHYPDIYSFIEYVVGYAKGFGYINFSPFGPGNLLLLLFSSIIYLVSICLKREITNRNSLVLAPLMASAGCIWGVASYYVGRPVAQNITAMIPILVLTSYFSLLSIEKNSLKQTLLPLKLAILPFLFIVFATLINPDFYKKIVEIKSFSTNIDTKKPLSSNEIYLALDEATLTGFSVIFYGDNNQSTAPVMDNRSKITNESPWLPIPLQLVEVPLREHRRSKYLGRYICENKISYGAIVMPMSDQLTKRFSVINNTIVEYYDLLNSQERYGYVIYKYRLKDAIKCL